MSVDKEFRAGLRLLSARLSAVDPMGRPWTMVRVLRELLGRYGEELIREVEG